MRHDNRQNWGQPYALLPPLDLARVQLESWQWFLQTGLPQGLAEISPLEDFTGKNWLLELGRSTIGAVNMPPLQAVYKGLTHAAPIKVAAKLTNKQTAKATVGEVFLGDLPQMTDQGTFVINGVERVVINQIVRSPGVYFGAELDPASGRLLHKAELRPTRGTWLEFEVARNDVVSVRIDRRRKFVITVLLRALGLGDEDNLRSALAPTPDHPNWRFLEASLVKDTARTTEEAVMEIYKKMRPGEPAVLENAQRLVFDLFFNPRRYDLGRVGRYKINKRLGLGGSSQVLTGEDLVATVNYLLDLQNGQGSIDDIDHLANRRLRRVGELVAQTAFRSGLLRLERTVREKMSLVSTEEESVTPAMLVNARPVISAINEFFRSSQLSQILDQTNPLSEIEHLRRLSVMGPGGISRERASFSIRDVNSSQYSRIDPVRSPEGPNIGLVIYLALYAKVNEYGFLEAPYRRVVKEKVGGKIKAQVSSEIVYLPADDEEQYRISHSDIQLDRASYILDEWLPIRYQGTFTEGPADSVDLVDVVPRQVVGTSAALIPFLAHDAANRALMGTNMQCQAVPLLKPEAPIVGTGMEVAVAAAMGWTVKARHAGRVMYVDADRVVVKLERQPTFPPPDSETVVLRRNIETYFLVKFKRTSPSSTCYTQRPAVKPGQPVAAGQVLIDGPACDGGELALGQNLIVAYTSFEGLGYEDAIVISERLVAQDVLTSIHIEEYEADVVETKLGPEELTRDIPNVGEVYLANLDSGGIVTIGSQVGPNDILVGKIAPKGETELSAEERLLRSIFGEKARDVRDTSLRMPHGERGIVVAVQILDRQAGDELQPGVDQKVIVKVAQIRKITVGDKLAGRHGNKGVISKIVPVADMPYLPDGTPVDLIISPLSVLARMNLGQLLETRLGWAMSRLGQRVAAPVFEAITEERLAQQMKQAGLPVSGKVTLINSLNGQPYEEPSLVGIGYIMKLSHMVEDKTHARSTGPYSLVTQQPLGGKAQMGGQRLGEMEVWALEAHKAAHTLQEMLTIKSDDVVGRAKAFEAIVKGTDIPSSSVPESFNVLVKELQSLGLQVVPQGVKVKPGEEENYNIFDFSGLQIKLASPEVIKQWSRGEVTKPETINYRTLRPEKDGLFDERIFGPVKDWECYCGKYKRIRYKGVICDKCGVEVTNSRVRRERMGHINLSAPVAGIWYFKGAPSKLSLLLDVVSKNLEAVIYFAQYLVTGVDVKQQALVVQRLQKQAQDRKQAIRFGYASQVAAVEKQLVAEQAKLKKGRLDPDAQALALEQLHLKVRQQIQALADQETAEQDHTASLYQRLVEIAQNLHVASILTEEEYAKLVEYDAVDGITVGMGAEALLEVVKQIDLASLVAQLRQEVATATGQRHVKATKRLKVADGLRRVGIDPAWMIYKVLPVIPPDLRPMVQLSGGRFATSDLNDLYRRVINRNHRLKHLIDLGAPEIILRNEKRMLQEAVDALIDSAQRSSRVGRPEPSRARSLSDMLRGKQGRFRQNLLGKRVDYSGRSVIVVGPELKLQQTGLPKEMALEMFKPYVLRQMIVRGLAPNVKSAKNLLDARPPEVFDILEEITRDHPVLLNRAPTLHKLSIQAFYPVLIEGSAIRIHPCICAGYNADFDGDMMAVHVPIGKEAIAECVALMLPEKNLRKPADGTPITIPSTKEMVLGNYYLTSVAPGLAKYPTALASPAEAVLAYHTGRLKLRQLVVVWLEGRIVETTVGRILFNEVLPEELRFVNEPVRRSTVVDLFNRAFRLYPTAVIVKLIDDLKDLGFWAGTLSGLSVSVTDCTLCPDKDKVIAQADKRVWEIERNFTQGLITAEEKRRLSQEVWLETTEALADLTWEQFAQTNPLRLIIDAQVGRASREQVKQLSAMRGLVVDPLGRIVDLPIKGNYRQGFSTFEYVTAARGDRKGLSDTSIRTADAGYLTRRLVDVAHDAIVRQQDCGTTEGLTIRRTGRRGKFLASRVFGRVLASDVAGKGGKVLVEAGTVLDEAKVAIVESGQVAEVVVRSPLTCVAKSGLCASCYGWDLAAMAMAQVGDPVGVIAAQSIGEPGTQMTLHGRRGAISAGGGVDVTQGLPRIEELFEARTPKLVAQLAEISGKAEVVETDVGYRVRLRNAAVKPVEEREYLIPLTAELKVADGQSVVAGTALAAGPLDIKEVLEVRGLRGAQEYLIEEIQLVYESQGVPIHDKHFEVIVKKMSDRVRVVSCGDTALLPGDVVERAAFQAENSRVLAAGGEPATAQVVILGITRAALKTASWLSAASFIDTTSQLAEAAIEGRVDPLLGLKENVIIGRLIPTDPQRAQLEV